MDLQNISYLFMKFHTDRSALGAVLASAEEDGFHTRVFWLEELQAQRPEPARRGAGRTCAALDARPNPGASFQSALALPRTLWITDSAAGLSLLRAAHVPCAACLTDWNAAEDLGDAPYLLSDLAQIDADDFDKIYQRGTGLPWTILRTRRLLVREFTDTDHDLDALYRLYSDPEAARFLSPLLPERSREREALRSYIRNVYSFYGFGSWALVQTGEGTACSGTDGDDIIGRMGFGIPDAGRSGFVPSFGYLIRADCRRQGFAIEAARAILDYGFRVLDFEEIDAVSRADNAASLHLLQRVGFQPVPADQAPEAAASQEPALLRFRLRRTS